jgi:poly(3-hydroxybutyrate) depolymerase
LNFLHHIIFFRILTKSWYIFIVMALLGWSGPGARVAASGVAPRGNFMFTHGGHALRVWYFRSAATPADAPVLFVMHGVGRNAEEYLDDWIELATQKQFLVVVPEFSKAEFPGEEAYNSGNMFDKTGHPTPRERWSYSMIEPLFDALEPQLGHHRKDYMLFGHSAGAQFVHRFVYFMPEARYTRAVAANAGWYTLPSLDVAFPYGLKGSTIDVAALRAAWARPLVVLLGEADIDPKSSALRHTPEADAQGLYRFARGQFFYAQARAAAATSHAPFNWTLATAPGIAHSNKGMAPFAVHHFFP